MLNTKLNSIIFGDCMEELKKFPDNSIDLIFADPPYNLQLKNELYRPNHTKVSAVNDDWDKFASFQEYDDFCTTWLKECRRVLKDNGALWVIGSYHNIFRIGKILLDLGFWILNDVQWVKTNPMPNFKGTRFTNGSETLIWCKKSEEQKKYTFNYKTMKEMNGGKQMTSIWHIPICIGRERLRDENGEKLHSTQKPEELLKRIILSSTKEGDVVLDPFFGSGTTGAVCKKLRRNFIGIEKEKKYIKIAKDRINGISTFFEEINLKEENPNVCKVPFKKLVERGFVKAGSKLYTRKRYNKEALILDTGYILMDGVIGSIHQIGAIIEQSSSCNGWNFWYYPNGTKFYLIDELRKQYCSSGEKQNDN